MLPLRKAWCVLALVQIIMGDAWGQTPPPAPPIVSPPTRPAAFKGSWQGPSKIVLPGPGPKPGQSMPDYFASLAVGDRRPMPLHVLALGGSRGFHHDSVSAAMDLVYQAGKRSGLWLTEFATDYALVNARGGAPMRAGFQPQGLKDFDAIVIAGASGDWHLSDDQKLALLAFVHEMAVCVHPCVVVDHYQQ